MAGAASTDGLAVGVGIGGCDDLVTLQNALHFLVCLGVGCAACDEPGYLPTYEKRSSFSAFLRHF